MTFSANGVTLPLLRTPSCGCRLPFPFYGCRLLGSVRERVAGGEVLSQSGKRTLLKAPPINHGLLDAPGKASFEASEKEASEYKYLGEGCRYVYKHGVPGWPESLTAAP